MRALLMASIATLCLAGAPALAAPKVGDTPPDIVGLNVDREPVTLSTYAGKVVVVSFWASWCPPCLKELPILEGIQRTAGKGRVQVIAVNVEDRDTFRIVARKMTSLQLLVASDDLNQTRPAYGVNGIPHMVIVGKDGRIVQIHRGYAESGLDDVVADLNKALQDASATP